MIEHMVVGRWNEVRQPTEKELKATKVLRIPIDEASAKIRNDPPVEEEEDYELPYWAGEIPMQMVANAPVPDPQLRADIPTPNCLRSLKKGATKSNPET